MPDQTDAEKAAIAATEVVTPDPRDAEILALRQQLADFAAKDKEQFDQVVSMGKQLKQATGDLARAEKRAKDAKSAPTGDFVSLDGTTYPIVLTVRANTTFDEVKKGHINEGSTLVVIDRIH